MTEQELYELTITVYSYRSVVDAFKEKNKLTAEEVRDRLQRELQIQAWSDAYRRMQNYMDWENSPQGKSYIEQEERASSDEHRTEGT